MAKKAIVLLADGFEDVEAITPIDYLRRAGIEVTTASISQDLTVTSRWGGIKLTAGTTLTALLGGNSTGFSCDSWDAVVLPGGMPGAKNLAASGETAALLKAMSAAGKLICAICASPVVVLAPLGLINGKKFTCYPGMEKDAASGKAPDGCQWSDESVVIDGNIITSRAAGTAGKWAIAIIGALLGEEAGKKIAETVLL